MRVDSTVANYLELDSPPAPVEDRKKLAFSPQRLRAAPPERER